MKFIASANLDAASQRVLSAAFPTREEAAQALFAQYELAVRCSTEIAVYEAATGKYRPSGAGVQRHARKGESVPVAEWAKNLDHQQRQRQLMKQAAERAAVWASTLKYEAEHGPMDRAQQIIAWIIDDLQNLQGRLG